MVRVNELTSHDDTDAKFIFSYYEDESVQRVDSLKLSRCDLGNTGAGKNGISGKVGTISFLKYRHLAKKLVLTEI